MSIEKTMIVGRRKLQDGKRKKSISLSIDPDLLIAMNKRIKYGNLSRWAEAAFKEALKK